jgi:hypothetical protein
MSEYESPPVPPDFFKPFIEPPSPAAPVAPYNHVTATPSGHSFEMDDTLGVERIRLQHRTGTFIEMGPDGSEVHKVYGNGYEITIQNKQIYVKGNCEIYVDGDAYMQVKGNKTELIGGDYDIHVQGNFIVTSEKQTTLTSVGDTNITAGAGIGGGLKINTGDYTYMNGDLSVNGEIVGNKITSRGRVDAVDGVSAGPLGFVTMLGGVSVGIPAAVPGQINSDGPINSLTSVSAPVGNFGIMDAVWSYDTVNLNIFNSHTHPAPEGETGPPIPFEVGA